MSTAEQELDKVYHALPEWVRRNYPEASVAERVKHGFEDAQKTWSESLMREVQDHAKTREFLVYLIKTKGLDLGQEYWNFLISKDKQKSEKGS